VWLGRVSYSLYITHTLTLAVASVLISRVWEGGRPTEGIVRAVIPVLVYAAVIAVAAAVFHLVEEPARHGLRRALSRHRVAP